MVLRARERLALGPWGNWGIRGEVTGQSARMLGKEPRHRIREALELEPRDCALVGQENE